MTATADEIYEIVKKLPANERIKLVERLNHDIQAATPERSAPPSALATNEKTWDQRILELVPSGVDVTQIDENLRLTPTERVERMLQMLHFLEDAKASNGHRSPPRR